MQKCYQVTLHSQMGPRQGQLTLRFKGSSVTGFLELVGFRNSIHGVRAEDGKLHLFHSIKTVVRTFPCETVLELNDHHLTGVTTAEPCRMRWDGVELSFKP